MDYLDQAHLDIVISQEKAAEFIKANVPSHKIFHVEGDRLCTLRSFLMRIRSTFETDLTLDDIISTFRKKYSENAHICQPFSSDDDLCNVFERFLENSLGKYNENTTDLFLHALCNSYNENIILIKSDRNSSWIEDITPNAGGENKTLNFVKTLSEHIDPILSCAPQTMGGNNASTNTNDDSDLEIIRFIQKNGASANNENIDDDSDVEITEFIPGTARSTNTSSKTAGYIPIKIENDGTNCSKDEIDFVLSHGDKTGKLVICCVRWQTKINIQIQYPISNIKVQGQLLFFLTFFKTFVYGTPRPP